MPKPLLEPQDKATPPCQTEYRDMIPCLGPDGYCYGPSAWGKRSFRPGEKTKAELIRKCPWHEQVREWWRRTQTRRK